MSKISVIVPIYNSEKYLNKCLDSLVNQTFKDIEIVLVNDGSTDGSEEIIKDYLEKDDRIIYFKQPNGGQASARNLGLSKASGEYISYLDSDDYVDLDMLETIDQHTKDGYDIILSDYYINRKDGEEYHKLYTGNIGEVKLIDYWKFDTCPWNKVYKKSFLLDNHFSFPEGIMYEDFASIPTLVKYEPKLFYCGRAFVHYVLSDVSTMRSEVYKRKYEDIFEATNYLYNNLNGCGFDQELEELICIHVLYYGSLNFYRFKKYEQIDKISDLIRKVYPKWSKNKYIKAMSIKRKVLMHLFYDKKYEIIRFVQKIKK